MFRYFFIGCFLAVQSFAALPYISEAQGNDISETEEALGYFSIIGDAQKTPFRLQITFENCNELRDNYGNTLPFTTLMLKYQDTQNASSWKTLNFVLPKGQNCFKIIEFYNDVQEVYNMELWVSWDKKRAKAGTFYGRASFDILPKP